MTPTELISELRSKGVTLKAAEGKIRYEGPKDALTDEIKTELKRHKPQVIELLDKQAVIEKVASYNNMNRPLSHKEFTSRLLILMRAWRDGIVDDQTKDEGLNFLLAHWRPGNKNRQ